MRLFGTDGIRATVNKYPMIPEVVCKVGMAAANILKHSDKGNKILIGKDTRISGDMIESALISGLCSMGMNVILSGVIPTPAVAFLTRTLRLAAGIMISASHNSFQDNGIKFFGFNGFKLPDKTEEEIEKFVINGKFYYRPTGVSIGRVYRLEDATGRYIEFIKSSIPKEFRLKDMKIVVDCANGAAYKVTPILLNELGADVVVINDQPNGVNINFRCGSTDLKYLKDEVIKQNAFLGIAHDGDADRTILIDEKTNEIDGDLLMALCAIEMKKRNKLKTNTIVTTIMTNLGIEKYLQNKGINMIRTKVGDKYVLEKMLRGGYNFGGEKSGHIIFLDYNTTGDGPITALQMLYLIKLKNKPLSEIVSEIVSELYPQKFINIEVKNKKVIKNEKVENTINKLSKKLNKDGRIIVRLSGTEQKIRIMVEGKDENIIEEIAQEISEVIKSNDW